MDYNKIISVTGLSGLYELVTSKADGAVVRSLEDKSTKFVSSRQHNFSHLESIEVFTTTNNTNLAEVFTAMNSSSEKMPDTKADGKELKSYFEKINPDIDFDRVYASDMKKMIKWLEILKDNKIDIKSDDDEEGTGDEKLKTTKPAKKDIPPVKEGKPVNPTTRKIESRGVK